MRGRCEANRSTIGSVVAAMAVLLVPSSTQAGVLVVEDAFREAKAGRFVDVHYDASGSETLDEALAGPWTASEVETPNLGFRRGALWARLRVEDRRASPVPLAVAFPYAPLDEVTLCERREGVWRCESAGDHVARARWPRPTHHATFRLDPEPKHDLLVRVRDASLQLPMIVRAAPEQDAADAASMAGSVAFAAIAAALALYNLLLRVGTGLEIYGRYVAYSTVWAAGIFALNGFGFAHVWVDQSWWNDHLGVAMPLATAGAMLWLYRGIASEAHDRRADRGLLAVQCSAFAMIPATFTPWPIPLGVMGVGVVGSLAAVTMASTRAALRGSRSARLFLVAFGSVVVTGVHGVLVAAGAVPSLGDIAVEVQASAALELVLFAYALADRIKQLQADATANAELAASHARAAEEATARALAEQERTNVELKRLDKLKDDFLANTSHELRTPLHGILGLTEGVLRSAGGLDRGSRERLEMVVASGRRLASLVNDILDFSKLRHQELDLREKNLELRGAVAMTLAVLAPSAEPKGLALVNAVPEGVVVRADESRLQQILTNLIGNAVKFTANGSVTVSARAREDVRIEVAVCDTGIGIAKEAQGRVFESFEQADGSTAREYGGTGLGLAVTKQLVELHGGTIRLASELGAGSTFSFDLAAAPAGVVAEADRDVSTSPGARDARPPHEDATAFGSIGAMPVASRGDFASVAPRRRARLLVADDDAVNLEVLKAQLEPEGHEVVVARDGAQAVETLERSGPFDGVLLDVMMPKMTGPQAAEQMRAQYPHGTLPILMLTAKNRPEDAVTGLRAGADDYVGKPFHRDELLARLDVHLDAAKTRRALERFVRPRLVELAGKARPSELVAGEGRGLNAILARFTIEGLGELAAKHDERTFFERVGRVVRALVEQVELHGGVVEAMSDDQLSAIFVGGAEGALLGAQRALWAARDASKASLHVAAILHAGAVNVGAVGADDWIAVHALGEAALVASAVGRWAARAGFGLVATDTLFAKLETAPRHRYLGAARVGAGGHPAGLHEIGEGLAPYDEALRALEHGDAARAAKACEHAPREDHLVRAILEAAERRQRDIAIL